jgi:predicted transcriptional regulator
MAEDDTSLRELTANVAAAYFSNSHVGASDIPGVIAQIASSLASIGSGGSQTIATEAAAPTQTRATPAQIRRSVTADALISFEDGKSYKTMKRHLSGRGLTPEQYREKWGLPHDYPMVAPSYSEARAAMARELGLGQRGAQARAAASKAKVGRPRKA